MYPLIRPVLFSLEPETAHHFTLASLRFAHRLGVLSALFPSVRSVPRKLMGIEFPNPVGLAAGLDKNGDCIDAMAALGFGFIEIGTVTPRAQPGNPRPRMFRLPDAQAVINRMGFNNRGVDALVENVRCAQYKGVLGINIGKNLDTPLEHAADDYVACLRKVYAHASYITVNISSPNTLNLRQLQQSDALAHLLGVLRDERSRLADMHGKRVPVALKVAPDLEDAQIAEIAGLIVAHGLDAAIVTNTTTDKSAVAHLPHGNETGGLSGAPLTQRARTVIAQFAAALDGAVPIVGAGGTMTGADASASVAAGASLVQLYTGFVYSGPALISECVAALAGRSEADTAA